MPIYDPSTHNDLVSVTITLAAIGAGSASLTTPLLLVASVTPGGSTIAEYADLAEVVADIANLNTIAQSMATAVFGQANVPDKIYIQGVNTGGGQTYVQALAAALASGADVYYVLADTRTVSDQLAIAAAVETTHPAAGTYLLFVTQDDDADWLTSGIPSAWSAAEGYERTAVCYHDDNANDAPSDRLDCALVGQAGSVDPDVASQVWTVSVLGVDDLAANLTSTQKGFARANYANVALPKGTLRARSTTGRWVDPGKTLAGRPIDHIVSVDWLRTRLAEDVNDAIIRASDRGTKLTVDLEGQGIIGNVIEARFIQGVRVKHFTTTDAESPPYRLTPLTITSADIAAQRVRFDGEVQLATGVRQVPIAIYASADAIVA